MKDFIFGIIVGLIVSYILIPQFDIMIFDPEITFVDNNGICYQYKEKNKDINNENDSD
jgi:hypothetical protein